MPTDQNPRVSPKKLGVVGIAVVCVAAFIVVTGVASREKSSAELRTWTDEQAIPSVAVMRPDARPLSPTLELPGRLEAYFRAPIYARVSGYVNNWKADIGAQVKTGQLLAQIEEAFSVESVTEEFFREFVRLFDDTEAALVAIVKRDKGIRDDFSAKGVITVDFAKKLVGQIVFLYFLQKKGWLGVTRGGRWGDGPRAFLRQLADRAVHEQRCLFDDVLEPLFYDTLATDRGHEAW